MSEPIFIRLGIYVVVPEPISVAYFINPPNQPVCLCMYPPNVAKKRFGKVYVSIFSWLGNCLVNTFLRGECTLCNNVVRVYLWVCVTR
jgi:hypothetical protein